MTVKELIEWLSTLNPDAVVYSYGDDGYFEVLDSAEFESTEDRVYL